MAMRPSGRLVGGRNSASGTLRPGRTPGDEAERGRGEPHASTTAGRAGEGAECGQPAGQMALDTRQKSTCGRPTKAIPVRDMTEAWHAGLRTVHHYPGCGLENLDQ